MPIDRAERGAFGAQGGKSLLDRSGSRSILPALLATGIHNLHAVAKEKH